MNLTRYFPLILLGLFAILSCQNNSTGSGKSPQTVQFVSKSAEEDDNEQGIDAIPEGDAIYFSWHKLVDNEIDKYEIYRQTDPERDFYLIDTVQDTFYIDNLDYATELNQRMYYFILSVNFDLKKSESSDTISYKLLEKPTPLMPSGIINSNTPLFQWNDINQANDYIIRVKRSDTDHIIWNSTIQANFGSTHQQIGYNSDGMADVNALSTEIPYEWRVDVIGPESNCGSESAWTSFQIQ